MIKNTFSIKENETDFRPLLANALLSSIDKTMSGTPFPKITPVMIGFLTSKEILKLLGLKTFSSLLSTHVLEKAMGSISFFDLIFRFRVKNVF